MICQLQKKPNLREMYNSIRNPVGEVSGQTFVPILWMKGLENLSLNGLEQKHHLQSLDSVFWLHQVAANTKMYGWEALYKCHANALNG